MISIQKLEKQNKEKTFIDDSNKIIESLIEQAKTEILAISKIDNAILTQSWKENYDSLSDFIFITTGLKRSSFQRKAKSIRLKTFLLDRVTDDFEKTIIYLMHERVFRLMRTLFSPKLVYLRLNTETEEQHFNRISELENKDFEFIYQIWKKVYPLITESKQQNKEIFPNGEFKITEKDFSSHIKKLDNTILSNKVISNKIQKDYVWDKYYGILKIKKGRLILESNNVVFDLIEELSDLLDTDTLISVRRINRDI